MFPGIDGFAWDAGHIIFLGVFYAVVGSARGDGRARRGAGVGRRAVGPRREAALARRLRGAAGEFPPLSPRTRGRGGDRRSCENSLRLPALRRPHRVRLEAASLETGVRRRRRPSRRSRGSSCRRIGSTTAVTPGWARHRTGRCGSGSTTSAPTCWGRPDELELPPVGARLVANGTAWRARKNGVRVRVLAPVDGEVVAVGGPGLGWYLRIRPDGGEADVRHLLTAAEARPWLLREVERLQTGPGRR